MDALTDGVSQPDVAGIEGETEQYRGGTDGKD